MKEKPTFKRSLSDAIYSAHRLRDISKSKARRFNKEEMFRHLVTINILRQEHGGNFDTQEQRIIAESLPELNNAIIKGRYVTIDFLSRKLLDALTTKTAVVNRGKLPHRKTVRITPKTPKLRR